MEAIAKTRHIRQSAKKVRFVLTEVSNMPVDDALKKLAFINKKAAKTIYKTISSAASNYYQLDNENEGKKLFIKTAYVDEGPVMKRFRPAAMGRAVRILKRTSHLTIVVSDTKQRRN
tara:strand:- start:418 stop:768 length:351 start_codon:yes stop_codon:yes gene_type:complete